MEDCMISVVIPSYNYKRYLPQAVSSVAAQTYENLELVIVDDASKDGSAEEIKRLAKQYECRFSGGVKTIFHSENSGAHAAINEGIARASGRLVAILNADDLYERERFTLMAGKMGNARFAFSAVRCVGEDGARLATAQAQEFENIQRHLAGKRFTALSAVAENVAVSTGNLLFEKTLYTELGGFRNYKYVHDYDFFLRACLRAEPAFIGETAYLYRLHGENSFTRLQKEGLRENRMVWLDVYAMVKRGDVQNPVMREGDYKREFYAAVCEAGKKKQTLWRMAGNPAVSAGLALLKKRYGV